MSPNDNLARNDGAANSWNSFSTVTLPRNEIRLILVKSETSSSLTPEWKQGSSFYTEPAEAVAQNAVTIPRNRPRNNPTANKYRHDKPGWLKTPVSVNSYKLRRIGWKESDEKKEKTPLISSFADNLTKRCGTKDTKEIPRAKSVQLQMLRTKVFSDTSCVVDSSGEFGDNE
jgi:hypothetical protein